MDAPPADPYEGTLLYDEPGVRAYIFAQRVHAIAHFLRATHGVGAVIALLGRRAPELRHIRRWLQVLFSEPVGAGRSTQLLAGWFATGGAGVVFVPTQPGAPYSYHEVGIDIRLSYTPGSAGSSPGLPRLPDAVLGCREVEQC